MLVIDGRLRPLLVTTVAVCLVASGCGGDSDADAGGGETPAGERAPDAKQSPAAFARELADLIADTTERKDCKPLDAITLRSTYRFECPSPETVRADMAFFEVTKAVRYGTGAVLEYKSETARQGGTMILFLGPDREWGLSHFKLVTESPADSSDADSRAGYAHATRNYLRAVRERDCKRFTDYAAIQSPTPEAACKVELPGTKLLARLLRRNPDSEPVYLGGSEDFGFFRLELERPTPAYVTLTVFKTPEGSLRPFAVQPPTYAPGPTGSAAASDGKTPKDSQS